MNRAALVVPESSGILWASRTLGQPLPEFTPGIDLMLSICRMCSQRGHPAYFLGSAPGVSAQAARILEARFPGFHVVGALDGYFTEDEEPRILSRIQAAKPSILFVGLGMPRQEKWIAAHFKELGIPVVMGVGGSFDVISGRLSRAPALMRQAGVEWLYRWAQEPWRWKRMAQLPVFAWKVLRSPKEKPCKTP